MLMNVKSLPSLLGEGKKYVILDVLVRWISLAAGIAMIYAVALTMDALYSGLSGGVLGLFALMAASGAMFVRYLCIRASCRFRISASMAVKEGLYDRIVRKAEHLGIDVDEIDDAQLNEEDVSLGMLRHDRVHDLYGTGSSDDVYYLLYSRLENSTCIACCCGCLSDCDSYDEEKRKAAGYNAEICPGSSLYRCSSDDCHGSAGTEGTCRFDLRMSDGDSDPGGISAAVRTKGNESGFRACRQNGFRKNHRFSEQGKRKGR